MDNPQSAPTYTAILPPPPASERNARDPRNFGSALRIIILMVVVGAMVTALVASLVSSAAAARVIAYPAPRVEISSTVGVQGSAIVGQAITFSAIPSAGRDLTYNWDFGDGSGATGQVVSHTYSDYQQGGYQVSVTALDPLHQSATASLNFNVLPPAPSAQFTHAVDSSGSGPLTIDFDASGSTGDGLTYNWDFGDGNSGQGAQVSNTYQSVGTYTVTLTVSDVANQQSSVSQSVSVTIAKPVAAFTATQYSNDGFGDACYSFDASASTGYSLTYNWAFGDGNTESGDSGPQTQYCYSASGSYPVTLTVVDGVNQSSQISHTISY